MRPSTFGGIAAALVLAGCGSPEDFESEPIQVKTKAGDVTCQLYTRQRLDWDRSIGRPETMTVAEADAICAAAGRRWANGEDPTVMASEV